jgi:hypothetical protein
MTAVFCRPRTRERILHLIHWLTLAAIVVGTIEICAAVILRFGIEPNARFLIWDPNLDQMRGQFLTQGSPADTELVWPKDATAPPRDATGAKFNPDFPEAGHACVSAYGDSFVWGDDVPLADGWVEQLSRRLGCRVANYGVSGYGTDQAYLRFQQLTNDEAPTVLLGLFPEMILRDVNQYRGFIGWGGGPYELKGRFLLDASGKLEWSPRPSIGPDDVPALLRKPAEILPHEYFLPDSRNGPTTVRFPYSLTLARVALSPAIRAMITRRPIWTEFYAPEHPSGALALTTALIQAFARTAAVRGKRVLVVVLPSGTSFRGHAVHGDFEYAPLVSAIAAKGIDVLDGGAALLTELAGRDYCMLFSQPKCRGHYGSVGGTVVAAVVAAALRQHGLEKAAQLN